jgi:DNA modification methylase
MPEKSVHCCVTSPPYFGLRDYGTAKWDSGNPACEHSGVARRCDVPGRNDKQSTSKGSSSDRVSRTCIYCGAVRIDSQIGLEATPDAFVAEMVAVFREVRRVLRDDGTLWLNLGDAYVHTGAAGGCVFDNGRTDGRQSYEADKTRGRVSRISTMSAGLKAKNLIGIPWRVAFALQADGWYLRQDIIWSKPNPMPESVTDRCTKAHEYIFLMSKSARYFYDAGAISEIASGRSAGNLGHVKGAGFDDPFFRTREGFAKVAATEWQERNKRSVWEVATQPFSEAHFATFPPELIEPCIKAGCPVGGTVLDPFGGAGTTGMVADRLCRDAILIELNPDYAAMAERRIRDDAGMFAVIA